MKVTKVPIRYICPKCWTGATLMVRGTVTCGRCGHEMIEALPTDITRKPPPRGGNAPA